MSDRQKASQQHFVRRHRNIIEDILAGENRNFVYPLQPNERNILERNPSETICFDFIKSWM